MQALAIEAVQGLNVSLVWSYLLHSIWIGLFAAAVVALVFQTRTRLSHNARHVILLVALGLVTVGPAVATLLLHAIAGRASLIVEPGSVVTVVSSVAQLRQESLTSDRTGVQPSRATSPSRARYVALFTGCLSSFAAAVGQVRLFVLTVWLLGVALGAGFLALGTRAVLRLCYEADPASPRLQEKARTLARRLRLKKPPSVLVHLAVDEPCLCGFFRLAILLPAHWLDYCGGDLLESILAHELAHAQRLDHVVNLAQRLVETLLFFHPAVHWLSCSLRRQREFCADALAVRLTRDPLALAGALESVALLRLASPAPPAGGTSLGGQTSSLLPRIQELIGMTPSRPRRHVWPLVALPAAALMALIAAAAGPAQDRPASPSSEASAKSAPAAGEQINSPKESVSRTVVTQDRTSRTVTERQIAYEVRYVLHVDADSWRNLLKDRLKLVMQEADVSAWIIDDKAVFDLLVPAQGDVHTNILQAPKVTAYENARATIVNRSKTKYVAGMECRRNASGAVGFIPIIKDYEVGCEIDITGRLLPHGAQLSVDLRDSSLLVLRNLLRKEWVGDRQINATYQVPTMIERHCRTSCDLFEGSSLLISLGLDERRDTLSGAAGAASHLLEAVGLPHLEPTSVTCERLVLITPRRIVLEAEERPITGPARAPVTPGST